MSQPTNDATPRHAYDDAEIAAMQSEIDTLQSEVYGYSSKWENYVHPVPVEPEPPIPTDYTGMPVFDYTHTATS